MTKETPMEETARIFKDNGKIRRVTLNGKDVTFEQIRDTINFYSPTSNKLPNSECCVKCHGVDTEIVYCTNINCECHKLTNKEGCKHVFHGTGSSTQCYKCGKSNKEEVGELAHEMNIEVDLSPSDKTWEELRSRFEKYTKSIGCPRKCGNDKVFKWWMSELTSATIKARELGYAQGYKQGKFDVEADKEFLEQPTS